MGAWEELDTEIMAELDISDLGKISELNDEYGIFEPVQKIAEEMKDNIETGCKKAVEDLAKRNVSFQEKWINKNCKNPSGMLASSIDMEQQDDYSIITGTRLNHVYPMSVEYGRKGFGPIPPTKALAFYYEGELIFRKKVGPAEPRPFVAPAYEDTDKIAETIVMLEIAHQGINWD